MPEVTGPSQGHLNDIGTAGPVVATLRAVRRKSPYVSAIRTVHSGRTARSDVAAGEDDGSRAVLVRPDDQFGLDREPCLTKPAGDLARPAVVTVDVDRATRVALGRMSCFVAD